MTLIRRSDYEPPLGPVHACRVCGHRFRELVDCSNGDLLCGPCLVWFEETRLCHIFKKAGWKSNPEGSPR